MTRTRTHAAPGPVLSPEDDARAVWTLRHTASRHRCVCPEPAHARGEVHPCQCRRRGHKRDVEALGAVLEACGLTWADERLRPGAPVP